jgi:hypothetical protein
VHVDEGDVPFGIDHPLLGNPRKLRVRVQANRTHRRRRPDVASNVDLEEAWGGSHIAPRRIQNCGRADVQISLRAPLASPVRAGGVDAAVRKVREGVPEVVA